MATSLLARGTSTPCPYCFAPIDTRKVGFRCVGRHSTGSTVCVRHPDPRRLAVLGDGTPTLPPVLARHTTGQHIVDDLGDPELHLAAFGANVACDRCRVPGALAICPSCHSLLPEELPKGALSVAVVGARNAGKTVLLSVLEHQLIAAAAARFDAAIDHPGGTVGLANDLVAHRTAMETSGRLPDQTVPTGARKKAPSVYRWKSTNGGGSRIISLYDTAGEDVAHRDAAMAQQHLSTAHAVILVIDPFCLPENRARARSLGIDPGPENLTIDVLDGVATALRTSAVRGKVRTPLAVVVSKMDAFWDDIEEEDPLRSHGDEGAEFDLEGATSRHDLLARRIADWGGLPVLNKLTAEFSNYLLFPVSALGAEPAYASGELAGHLSPTRVLDPLLWILYVNGFLKRRPS